MSERTPGQQVRCPSCKWEAAECQADSVTQPWLTCPRCCNVVVGVCERTPGPWKYIVESVERAVIANADGETVFANTGRGVTDLLPEDARLIVAAVNACDNAGLSVEALEAGAVRRLVETAQTLYERLLIWDEHVIRREMADLGAALALCRGEVTP